MSVQGNGTAKQQAYSTLATSTAPSRNSVPYTLYHNDGNRTIASSRSFINNSTSNNHNYNIIGNAHNIIGNNNNGYKISSTASTATGNSIQYYPDPNYSNSNTTIALSRDATDASAYRNLNGNTYQPLYQNPLYIRKLQSNDYLQYSCRYTQSPLEIENDKKWLDKRRIKKPCKELDD